MNLKPCIVAMLVVVAGCTKNELEEVPQQTQGADDESWMRYPLDTIPAYADDGSDRAAYPTTTYVSVPEKYPAPGCYQAAPTSSVTYGGQTYYGGPFASCTHSISASTVTFKLKRTDGMSFPVNSVLKIKQSNAGGSTLASATLTSAASTCNLSFTESITWNLGGTGTSSNPSNTRQCVATWYNPVSGYTFYTQAIRIVAVPTGWGASLATLNGVTAYSNGWGGFSSTNYLTDAAYNNSQKYQCVHYIQKYYSLVYSRNIGNTNAGVYWTNYLSHNLTQRINNGAGIPQQGDIICFSRPGSVGHVGIVAGVYSGKLRVFQENVGQTGNNGQFCSGYKDFTFTNNGSSYTVSASVLGSTWTTLGWIR